MKKTTLTLALLVSMLGLGLLGSSLLGADPSTQETKKPVNKMCPVETKDEVDPKVTMEYKGKLIGFCCADCIPTFKKDPEKYMKDLK